MIDLSRIGDAISGLLGGSTNAEGAGSLLAALGSAGIDVAQLEGLSLGEVMDTLSQAGIDLGSFTPEQIQDLTGMLGLGGEVPEALASFFGGDGSRS